MSLEDADKLTPQIHLAKMIGSLEPSDVKTKRLIVMSPNYMRNLTDVLSSTPKDVVQTYLLWKVIQRFASVVEADGVKPYKRFLNKLQGKVGSSLHSIDWPELNFHRILNLLPSDGEPVLATLILDSAGS